MTRRPLRRGRWSFEEMQRLRALLPRRGVDGTAFLLRRTAESVRRKAQQILRVPARRGDWAPKDDALLMDAYGALELRLIGLMLGRPSTEVTKRAAWLRSTPRSGPFAADEIRRLKRLYGTRDTADLEVCMRRRSVDVEAAAERQCLQKDKRFAREQKQESRVSRAPRWTDEEVARLRQLYSSRDNLEVARALGRSVASVANKAWHLGLEKGPEVLGRIGRENVACRFRTAT